MFRKIALASTIVVLLLICTCIYLATRQPLTSPRKPTARTVEDAERRLSNALSPLVSGVPNIPTPDSDRHVFSHSPVPMAPAILEASISQDDLNDVLSGNTSLVHEFAKQGLVNVQVQFREPNYVQVSGIVTRGHGKKAITVGGQLSAKSPGKVIFTPSVVCLGLLPIPEAPLDGLIKRESGQLIGKGLVHVPMLVDRVEVKKHILVLSGKARSH